MNKEHIYVEPKDHDHSNDEYYHGCMICDGGLALCKICGGLEGGLTTECPNEEMSFERMNEVYQGKIDFVGGKWIEGVSIHSPARYRVRPPKEEIQQVLHAGA